MQVFISWSGEPSKKLGEAVSEWLGDVLQAVTPYFSPQGVQKGTAWYPEVVQNLKASAFGVLCLTRDNTDEPWILFEAGAVAGRFEKAHVCPVCFGFKPEDLGWPLAAFQGAEYSKAEMLKLVQSINAVAKHARIPEGRLTRSFERCWQELDKKVSAILAGQGEAPPPEKFDPEPVLKEILELCRIAARRRKEETLPPVGGKPRREYRFLSPAYEPVTTVDDVTRQMSEADDPYEAAVHELVRRLVEADAQADDSDVGGVDADDPAGDGVRS